MKYPNGDAVLVGDLVELWVGCQGQVVACIDSGDYTPEFLESEWSYLRKGVLVRSDQAGLIHYLEPETTMRLLRRQAT